MAQFTLDDIRAAAEKKYGATEFPDIPGGKVRLLNVLRISKDKRKAVMDLQDRLDEKDADQEEILAECIRLVAESEEQANRLLDSLGGDLGQLAAVFTMYTGETELGEASASQD